MATLFGIVFFSHQIGSFLGVWLGGYLYDVRDSYDVIWWISIALGLIAALLHWPIDERAVGRLQTQR
jgi:predicted MFS family arabinose efflux permease